MQEKYTKIFAVYKNKCILDIMTMELFRIIKTKSGLTNYALKNALAKLGVKVSIQGLDHYCRGNAKSMRFRTLCGLRKISGLTWEQFGKLLDSEFGK